MTNRRVSGMVLALAAVTVGATASAASRSEVATTTSEALATPTGQPIGTATMTVRGPGTATIRYKINGGAEQTEANVALPWEKQYPSWRHS